MTGSMFMQFEPRISSKATNRTQPNVLSTGSGTRGSDSVNSDHPTVAKLLTHADRDFAL